MEEQIVLEGDNRCILKLIWPFGAFLMITTIPIVTVGSLRGWSWHVVMRGSIIVTAIGLLLLGVTLLQWAVIVRVKYIVRPGVLVIRSGISRTEEIPIDSISRLSVEDEMEVVDLFMPRGLNGQAFPIVRIRSTGGLNERRVLQWKRSASDIERGLRGAIGL